jgi:hypothetical protein
MVIGIDGRTAARKVRGEHDGIGIEPEFPALGVVAGGCEGCEAHDLAQDRGTLGRISGPAPDLGDRGFVSARSIVLRPNPSNRSTSREYRRCL